MPQHKPHRLYRAVVMLYPKAHREEYGHQMVQTFDDLLSERQDLFGRLEIWSRVAFELPKNLVEEHINNIRGINMSTIKPISKKVIAAAGAVIIIGLVTALVLILLHHDQYTPTTLSKVPKSATPPACAQDNPNLSIKPADETFIGNVVTTSIINVPAGTNVTVRVKSYDGSKAEGTAIYPSRFGQYNFVAKLTDSDGSDNDFSGGWKITHFEACKV